MVVVVGQQEERHDNGDIEKPRSPCLREMTSSGDDIITEYRSDKVEYWSDTLEYRSDTP